MPELLYIVATGVAGIVIGYGARQALLQKRSKDTELKYKQAVLQAKEEAAKLKQEAAKDVEKRQKYLEELEKTLRKREESIDKRLEELAQGRKDLDLKTAEVAKLRETLKDAARAEQQALEKVAKLKKEEALERLVKSIEQEYKQDIIARIKQLKQVYKEEAEKEARRILSTTIERIASEHTSESVTYSVQLPSEEMKGRIIGKEGRNIQHFEKVTGVDVIIDDTPDTVLISSFDPVRRYTAKLTLERLIADGRIQPSRIEEIFKKATEEVNKQAKEQAEKAAIEVGVLGLDPDLLKILGRLVFRTSYGQNQLKHAVEVATIAGLLAVEIGADVNIAKKAGLLHDLGKAVDHEVPGAHHHISMDIARKFGMSETVINAIGAHHDDIEPKTVEAILVRAADAISGARPGARRESYENYVKRLKDLENITNSFPGVEKSYAIQAGREVRIIVRPEEIDDLEALKLAKDIAKKIEQDMQYPGTIKVNVIRETRAVEYAK